jgi:diguanylate cyclase (GGDEF)-like protein
MGGGLPALWHEEDEGPDDDVKETSLIQAGMLVESAPPVSQSPYLMVVRGRSSVGRLYRVRGAMTIGRALGTEIVLQEEGVSRRHATVTLEESGAVRLTDLGSRNGVLCNNEPIKERILSDGDRIRLGDAVLALLFMDDLPELLHDNLLRSTMADHRTRLPNRRYFIDALRKEVAYSKRSQAPTFVLLFSIDHYRRLQDRYGDGAGDEVVRQLARTLMETVSIEGRVVARYAEDELALLICDVDFEDACKCADWFRRAAESQTIVLGGERVPITVSGGLARSENSGGTADELLELARQRLYRAKMSGRNRVETGRSSEHPD